MGGHSDGLFGGASGPFEGGAATNVASDVPNGIFVVGSRPIGGSAVVWPSSRPHLSIMSREQGFIDRRQLCGFVLVRSAVLVMS